MIIFIWAIMPVLPYGTRSFEVVYRFTKQAVETLFNEGCQLVILACNTASAKALRTIQQRDLPQWGPGSSGVGRNPSDGGADG